MTDDEIRQIFNMIDKDKSGKLSLRVTNYSLLMVVVVFVVGVVYDVVDKFWLIIDMIGKEEERQAVLTGNKLFPLDGGDCFCCWCSL